MLDPDAEATAIAQRAKLEPNEPHSVIALALGLELGVAYYPHTVLRGLNSLLFWPRGRSARPEIALRRGLTPKTRTWCIAHEIAEDHLGVLDYRAPDVEQQANAIAAALLMPRLCFREQVRDWGQNLPELADQFATTETAVALRLAEVRAVDVCAVVTPATVYVRAPEEFVLPAPAELRRLARTGHPGLRKIAVTDDRRRVALIA